MARKSLADVIAALRDSEGSRHCRHDEPGIRQRREADEEDSVWEVVEELGRNLCGQPCLARTSGPRQGDDPRLASAEKLRHFPDLALSADERGRLQRQVRRARFETARRWELAFQVRHDELEQPLSRGEVRQTVLAEVEHLGRVERAFSEEVARRLREEDLARVRGTPDALRAADAQPRVPVVRGDRFGRADADPEAADASRRALATDRGCNRVPRAGKGDEQGIAVRVQLEPAVLADDRSHEVAGRTLGLGQQEGDDAGRLGRGRGVPRRRERIGAASSGSWFRIWCSSRCSAGPGSSPSSSRSTLARVLESLRARPPAFPRGTARASAVRAGPHEAGVRR